MPASSRLTYGLIALNILAYLYTVVLGGSVTTIDLRLLLRVGALYTPAVVVGDEWWRLLSAMFLHGGLTHLLMNMVSLYLIGRPLERFLVWYSYLALYFGAGIVGGLLSMAVHPASVGVGASGAIFGIFGALAGVIVAHRERIGYYFHTFMKDFGAVLALNLLIGIAIPEVDMTAHIGGLLTGIVGGWLVGRFALPGLGVYLVLLFAICAWLAARLHATASFVLY